MKIGIITPAPPNSRHGNRVTALRWQRILRGLGHRVELATSYEGGNIDVMVALHARRTYPSVRRFHLQHPEAPLVVALTGTDLYGDLARSQAAQQSLRLASKLIVLQPEALDELPLESRKKARVIFQSVAIKPKSSQTGADSAAHRRPFRVCVVGHLRAVKDPLRTAFAARLLSPESRVSIVHIGRAMSEEWASRAQAEMRANSRYRWLGERSRESVRHRLQGSQLFVISSRMEGGANALGEAIVAGLPVLASRIPGNVGILGKNYPGYFPVGDTKALAELLARAESDPRFLASLENSRMRIAPLFDPGRERKAWAKLMEEIA